MAIRGKLHRVHLEPLERWLELNGLILYPPKGAWEILRAKEEATGRWFLVHSSNNDEHLSYEDKFDIMVSTFLKEYKQREAFQATTEALKPTEEFITQEEFDSRLQALAKKDESVGYLLEWHQGDFECLPSAQQEFALKRLGLERIVTVTYKVVATPAYDCYKCEDTGKLGRYGDPAKNEPKIVKSFCTCKEGLTQSQMGLTKLHDDLPY
jgi:hypothetical protein